MSENNQRFQSAKVKITRCQPSLRVCIPVTWLIELALTNSSRILAIDEIPLKYCMTTSLRHVVYVSLHVSADVRLTDAYAPHTVKHSLVHTCSGTTALCDIFYLRAPFRNHLTYLHTYYTLCFTILLHICCLSDNWLACVILFSLVC